MIQFGHIGEGIFLNFIFFIIPVFHFPGKKHRNYGLITIYNPDEPNDAEYDCEFSKKSIRTLGYHWYKYYYNHKYRLEYDLNWVFKKITKLKRTKDVVFIIQEAKELHKYRNISNYSEMYITEMLLAKFGIPYVPEGRGFI